jgi:glyoxylase-like metal-dependent hydrolase (beta-lactamase superfamily II)
MTPIADGNDFNITRSTSHRGRPVRRRSGLVTSVPLQSLLIQSSLGRNGILGGESMANTVLTRRSWGIVSLTLLFVTWSAFNAALAQCPGDCNGDGKVTVDELVAAVNVALRGCSEGGGAGIDGGACRPAGIEVDSPNFMPSPPGPTNVGGVVKINDAIYQASGFGNTFMVVTDEGNVIIDTSLVLTAAAHKQALQAIDDGPIKYIILTHAHPDHTGGVGVWKEAGTEIIGQSNEVDFLHYEQRLRGIFTRRNAAQFSELFGFTALPPFSPPDAEVINYGADIPATILFDRFYEFKLGGLTFQLLHTPGETYDHLTVWIPEYKIAFPGDNYYLSFPNMYTLRGTRPRWALDYVESLDTVLSWGPEILAPSHGNPLYGRDQIQQAVSKYRDAIQYVHDETVRGANAGKSAHTLMNEIQLPPDLDQGEAYGSVPWSIRGIYDGYIGWFDGNVSNISSIPASAAYPEVVELAGGAEVVAARAASMVEAGDLHRALHVADFALEAEPDNHTALQAKRAALVRLLDMSTNINERGWLNAGILEIDAQLASDGP